MWRPCRRLRPKQRASAAFPRGRPNPGLARNLFGFLRKVMGKPKSSSWYPSAHGNPWGDLGYLHFLEDPSLAKTATCYVVPWVFHLDPYHIRMIAEKRQCYKTWGVNRHQKTTAMWACVSPNWVYWHPHLDWFFRVRDVAKKKGVPLIRDQTLRKSYFLLGESPHLGKHG
jgi:hypothetical protein